MKILIVSPYPILPPLHGGRVRTARLAAGLARAGATVDVLCPWYPGQPRSGRVADAFTCHSHLLASNLLPWTLGWLAAPLALLSCQPLPHRWLRAFAGCDLVQFDYCAYAGWIEAVPKGARVVYSAHNVERDYCEHDGGRYLLSRASLARIESLERRLVERSDLVVTCTRDDATRLEQLYGSVRRTAVVPNGCPEELLSWDRGAHRATSRAALGLAPDDHAILFVGGDASHNREALAFLETEVLPRLDGRARLLVVGNCGRLRRRGTGDRVRFLGFVEDLRTCLAAADVAVNPVERGSGSSVKLLEYLAAGIPVVSTPIGWRGFDEPPAGVSIASRERFVDALRSLPAAPAGNRAVVETRTWRHLGRALLREYESLCES